MPTARAALLVIVWRARLRRKKTELKGRGKAHANRKSFEKGSGDAGGTYGAGARGAEDAAGDVEGLPRQ